MDDTAPTRTPHSGRPMPPLREDCWSEAATLALIQAWGDRYVELNRGNLKQKHWQEVADAVNARSAGEKTRKTDVQCKNRIDTLKKKYKIEKARVVSTNRAFISKWPYYNRIDDLLGPASAKKLLPSQAAAAAAAAAASASAVATVSAAVMKVEPPLALPLPYRPAVNAVPVVAAVRAKDKRPAEEEEEEEEEEEYVFRRIPMEAQSGSLMSPDSPESSEESGEDVGSGGRVGGGGGHGLRKLAKAIMKFTEIYEKVECAKQKQMMDLERQKMEFTKSLEYQKMQLFMDMQVELTKLKRVKRENFL